VQAISWRAGALSAAGLKWGSKETWLQTCWSLPGPGCRGLVGRLLLCLANQRFYWMASVEPAAGGFWIAWRRCERPGDLVALPTADPRIAGLLCRLAPMARPERLRSASEERLRSITLLLLQTC